MITEAGNRIDILITSDACAVLIENKIFAAVDNPFDDYAGYLDRLKDETGAAYDNKLKILLTLYPSGEGRKQGFVNLTYADFTSAVRAALGHHVSEAEPRYLPLVLDLLNTLENLGKGTRMNHEYRRLLADRSGEVEEFLKGVNEVRVELRGKVQELEALLDTNGHPNVTQIPWKPGVPLVHFLQTRVHTDEKSFIGVQTAISPSGWEIQIFSRGQGAPTRADLEDLLRKLGIEFEDDRHCVYPERFDYDEKLSRIARVVEEIVGKLSGAVR